MMTCCKSSIGLGVNTRTRSGFCHTISSCVPVIHGARHCPDHFWLSIMDVHVRVVNRHSHLNFSCHSSLGEFFIENITIGSGKINMNFHWSVNISKCSHTLGTIHVGLIGCRFLAPIEVVANTFIRTLNQLVIIVAKHYDIVNLVSAGLAYTCQITIPNICLWSVIGKFIGGHHAIAQLQCFRGSTKISCSVISTAHKFAWVSRISVIVVDYEVTFFCSEENSDIAIAISTIHLEYFKILLATGGGHDSMKGYGATNTNNFHLNVCTIHIIFESIPVVVTN